MFSGNPPSGIGKLKGHIVIIHVGLDPQHPTAGHGLETIFDDVINRLLYLMPIHLNKREIGAQDLLNQNIPILDFRR